MAQAISSEHAWLADIAMLHDLQARVLQQPSAFEARGISTDFEASSETNPDVQSKVEPASGATLEKLLEAETRAAEFYLASFSDDDPSTALLKASLYTSSDTIAKALAAGGSLKVDVTSSLPSVVEPLSADEAMNSLAANQQNLVSGLEAMIGNGAGEEMQQRLQQARKERDATLASIAAPSPKPLGEVDSSRLQDPAQHAQVWLELEKAVADSWAHVVAASATENRADAAKNMSAAYQRASSRGWQLTCWPGWL